MKIKEPKTFSARPTDVTRAWYLIDASEVSLGRLSTRIATLLTGKGKTTFTSHIDTGDGVIVINADKIKVTGAKEAQKVYRYHTGFVGGLREVPYRTMKARKPEYIIEHAVNGMMPKTRLSRQQLKRLRIYAGAAHDQAAQKPVTVNI